MLAVVSFQAYYVIDALWNEEAILTTMDITTDGFGSDMGTVRIYTQSRYLSMFPQDLSLLYLCGVVALNMLGLWVFRGSNGQKNAFRSNPNGDSVKHLEYMTTKSGSKLLVTGWGGVHEKSTILVIG
ncbi:Delta(14)-sterol reductase [Batrachochytrium salamandrivorans]|nr:Delta(14)-sterol reductase [Batrachochytrium salamandrivorans]